MKAFKTLVSGAIVAGAAMALAQGAGAADYPKKPINFIVPFGVGGSFDTIARKLGERWEKELGQPVVVKSLPGSGGRRGSLQIFRAKPDGYTIGFAHFVPFLADEFLNRKKPALDLKKFEMVYKIAHGPNYIFVRKDLPFKTVKDLAAAGRTIKFASTGLGAITWTEANALAGILNFKISFVLGYKKLADAAVAVAKGDAEAGLGTVSHFKGVKDDVRPLMFFGSERDPNYPDVPSAAELGLKRLTALGSPRIIVAPPGTPKGPVTAIRNAIKSACADKSFLAWMKKSGFYTKCQDPKSTWEVLTDQGKVFASLADAVAAAQKGKKKK
jgi:tripartite-type tricarboxylate transporter receptor subunit TctC